MLNSYDEWSPLREVIVGSPINYTLHDLELSSSCSSTTTRFPPSPRTIPATRTPEQHGFTPIPLRHRHRRLFGGGFHCFTLDTVRDGGPEDYFH